MYWPCLPRAYAYLLHPVVARCDNTVSITPCDHCASLPLRPSLRQAELDAVHVSEAELAATQHAMSVVAAGSGAPQPLGTCDIGDHGATCACASLEATATDQPGGVSTTALAGPTGTGGSVSSMAEPEGIAKLITRLRSLVASHSAQLARSQQLEAEAAEWQARAEQHEATAAAAAASAAAASAAAEAAQAELAERLAALTALQRELAASRAAAAGLAEANEGLAADVDVRQRQVTALTEANTALQGRADCLEEQLASVSHVNTQLQREVLKAGDWQVALGAEVTALQEQVEQLRARAEEAVGAREELLAAAREELSCREEGHAAAVAALEARLERVGVEAAAVAAQELCARVFRKVRMEAMREECDQAVRVLHAEWEQQHALQRTHWKEAEAAATQAAAGPEAAAAAAPDVNSPAHSNEDQVPAGLLLAALQHEAAAHAAGAVCARVFGRLRLADAASRLRQLQLQQLGAPPAAGFVARAAGAAAAAAPLAVDDAEPYPDFSTLRFSGSETEADSGDWSGTRNRFPRRRRASADSSTPLPGPDEPHHPDRMYVNGVFRSQRYGAHAAMGLQPHGGGQWGRQPQSLAKACSALVSAVVVLESAELQGERQGCGPRALLEVVEAAAAECATALKTEAELRARVRELQEQLQAARQEVQQAEELRQRERGQLQQVALRAEAAADESRRQLCVAGARREEAEGGVERAEVAALCARVMRAVECQGLREEAQEAVRRAAEAEERVQELRAACEQLQRQLLAVLAAPGMPLGQAGRQQGLEGAWGALGGMPHALPSALASAAAASMALPEWVGAADDPTVAAETAAAVEAMSVTNLVWEDAPASAAPRRLAAPLSSPASPHAALPTSSSATESPPRPRNPHLHLHHPQHLTAALLAQRSQLAAVVAALEDQRAAYAARDIAARVVRAVERQGQLGAEQEDRGRMGHGQEEAVRELAALRVAIAAEREAHKATRSFLVALQATAGAAVAAGDECGGSVQQVTWPVMAGSTATAAPLQSIGAAAISAGDNVEPEPMRITNVMWGGLTTPYGSAAPSRNASVGFGLCNLGASPARALGPAAGAAGPGLLSRAATAAAAAAATSTCSPTVSPDGGQQPHPSPLCDRAFVAASDAAEAAEAALAARAVVARALRAVEQRHLRSELRAAAAACEAAWGEAAALRAAQEGLEALLKQHGWASTSGDAEAAGTLQDAEQQQGQRGAGSLVTDAALLCGAALRLRARVAELEAQHGELAAVQGVLERQVAAASQELREAGQRGAELEARCSDLELQLQCRAEPADAREGAGSDRASSGGQALFARTGGQEESLVASLGGRQQLGVVGAESEGEGESGAADCSPASTGLGAGCESGSRSGSSRDTRSGSRGESCGSQADALGELRSALVRLQGAMEGLSGGEVWLQAGQRVQEACGAECKEQYQQQQEPKQREEVTHRQQPLVALLEAVQRQAQGLRAALGCKADTAEGVVGWGQPGVDDGARASVMAAAGPVAGQGTGGQACNQGGMRSLETRSHRVDVEPDMDMDGDAEEGLLAAGKGWGGDGDGYGGMGRLWQEDGQGQGHGQGHVDEAGDRLGPLRSGALSEGGAALLLPRSRSYASAFSTEALRAATDGGWWGGGAVAGPEADADVGAGEDAMERLPIRSSASAVLEQDKMGLGLGRVFRPRGSLSTSKSTSTFENPMFSHCTAGGDSEAEGEDEQGEGGGSEGGSGTGGSRVRLVRAHTVAAGPWEAGAVRRVGSESGGRRELGPLQQVASVREGLAPVAKAGQHVTKLVKRLSKKIFKQGEQAEPVQAQQQRK